MSVTVTTTDLIPVRQLGIRRVGVSDNDQLVPTDGQLAPVASDRVGPVFVTLGKPEGSAVEASGLRVTLQVTTGGRDFEFTQEGQDVYRLQSKEGHDVWVRGRIQAPDLTQLLRTNAFAVIFVLYDPSSDNPATPVHQEELVLEDFIGTALVNDATWRTDAQGYSFSHRIQGDLLSEGGRVYRAEFTLKTKEHGPCGIDVEIETTSRWTPRGYYQA